MVFQPLLTVLICLVLAYLLAELFRRFNLPRVVGQLSAGLVLGILTVSYALFTKEDLTILSFLADIGLILLFYYVGLETSINAFKKNIKRSLMVSLFNTLLPFFLGFVILRYAFGFDLLASLLIGVSLSVSAQSVSVDILEELNKLKSKLGNTIVSIGAVDDIVELILVTLLLSVFHFKISSLSLSRLLLDVFIFIIFIVVIKVWVLQYVLKFFDREHSSTSRFTGSIVIVLIIAILTEFLGFGLLIGAMIAGIIVRQTIYKEVSIPNWEEHDIARSTHIIAFGFLIPLFFVWVGLSVDLSLIAGNLLLIAVFIFIAFFGTIGGTIIAVMFSKGTLREGLVLGLGLNPKGDVELVIATLALKASIIIPAVFTALVIMSLSTTLISPIFFKRLVQKQPVQKNVSKGKLTAG